METHPRDQKFNVKAVVVCNMILTILTLLTIAGIGIFLVPALLQMKGQGAEFATSMGRVEKMIDQAELIPNVTWQFLANSTEQTKLVHVIEDVLDYWPRVEPKIDRGLDWMESIPNITLNFLANQTEQTKLIHMVEKMIYYWPAKKQVSLNSTNIKII